MAPAKKTPKKAAKPSAKEAGAKKKAAKSPPAKPAKKSERARQPAPPVEADEDEEAPVQDAPAFVREATAAERKAALEALLEKEGVSAVFPTVQNPTVPKPTPQYVRERSAQERKAVVEQLAQEAGVASALSKAPWKRKDAAEPPRAPAPAAPDAEAPPAERTSPKLQMTKAPIEPTAGRSAPRVVILDTNALMMQFQFHVDIEREVRRILNFNFEIVVPTVVVHELERLVKEGNQKEAGEARMARELAKTFRVEESGTDGDTGILRMAEKLNAVVVTNDKVLRARLRAKGIPNIYMRSRAFLTLDGHIPGM